MDPLHRDFPQKMSAALSENPASVIHSLNLAHNSLDNQGKKKNQLLFGCLIVGCLFVAVSSLRFRSNKVLMW